LEDFMPIKADGKTTHSALPAVLHPRDLHLIGVTAHRTSIIRWEREGTWPARIRLGYRSICWPTHAVIAALGVRPEDVAAAFAAAKAEISNRKVAAPVAVAARARAEAAVKTKGKGRSRKAIPPLKGTMDLKVPDSSAATPAETTNDKNFRKPGGHRRGRQMAAE
jgi:hypothetical protein